MPYRRLSNACLLLALVLGLTATAGPAGAAGPRGETSTRTAAVPRLPADAVTSVRPEGRWYGTLVATVAGPGRRVAGNQQTIIRIDGPRSRQRFRFDVALPPDAFLRARGDGIAAVGATGAVLGVLEAPWAVDALGISVATRFEVVDRDSFVQVVEHRPVGATYPVLADPWWVVPVIVREGGRLLGRYVVKRSTYEAAKRAAAKMAAEQADMSIDDLLAKSPVKLRSLTRANFRENVRRRTHWKKESIKGYDAHHTLPVKFEAAFNRAGLNIHNPIFGHWWCASAHRSNAAEFNRAWNRWLRDRRAGIDDTIEWRTKIERKRIRMVSRSEWASTYQCP